MCPDIQHTTDYLKAPTIFADDNLKGMLRALALKKSKRRIYREKLNILYSSVLEALVGLRKL